MKNQLALLVTLFSATAVSAFAQGTITTVAGSATCCNSSDGGQATANWLPSAAGIAVDKQGNLYVWDSASSKVRKVNTAGTIVTVAGSGAPGYTGDGGPATSASLFAGGTISGLAVDDAGNLYISDGQNHVVRQVDASGIIRTVAGTGAPGFSGDGGAASAAQLDYPAGIALDSSGNLYIADSSNNRVRKVDRAGVITTAAGNGNVSYSGDGVQAITTAVDRPEGVAVDGAGNLYISETSSSRVRKVDSSGIITTVAGQTKKTNGFSGDGGPATAATLYGPIGLIVDASGNLYIADNVNGRIRKVDAAGIITTYAGTGGGTASTPIGDGGPAAGAYLGVPKAVALDASGNLYIAGNAGGVARVRKVTATAALTMNPSSLSFSYTIGGGAPIAQKVAVSSASSAADFAASASTTSGGPWLSVSPASGTTPANLTVSVNPAGIPGGVYQGAITLTPAAAGASPQTFTVTLTVNGAGAPTFTSDGVVNALGYQTKLAPGAVFVVFGGGMGPSTLATASAPDYPLALGGTSVTFTPGSGATPISARMIYSSAGQVAGLLPSSVTPGVYAVRVTFNTLTSAPQNVTVVARSFGIAAANSAGTGTAQATIGNVNSGISLTRFTSGSASFSGLRWTLSPAHPGDTLVLWGTGGGADAANDTGGTSGDQTAAGSFSVIAGGRQIVPLYAGASSGYPGLWQINFTLPADIAPGCFVPVQVSAGGELSNALSIPIAAAGQDTCADPQLSRDDLSRLDAGGTIALGGFVVARFTATNSMVLTPGSPATVTTITQDSASGGIGLYTAAAYAALFGWLRIGECTVADLTASADKNPASPGGYLDAGALLPVAGPGLSAGAALSVAVPNPGPIYSLALTSGAFTGGGTYQLTAPGGKGLQAFSASVNFPSNLTISGWDSLTSIDRSKPLTLNWTSAGADQIYIIGSSYAVVGKDARGMNVLHTVTVTCEVPAAPGGYTIPVSVLSHLLPATIDAASQANGSATLAVEAINVRPFTALLTAGGQAAYAGMSGILAYSRNVAVQ